MRLFLRTPRHPRGVRFALACAAPFVLLAGCDIPTSAPIVDSRWVVPSQSASISVANLLPSGVTVMTDSSGFLVSASSASLSRSLSQDCGACIPLSGLTAPVPPFVGRISVNSLLPADVASATLVGGTLQVVVTNGYTFDPLRPAAASASAKGFAVITITSGSTVLGKDSVNGATTALPANGGTLTRSIPLAGTFTGSTPLTMSVVLTSPGGDSAPIDISRSLSASVTPTNLRVTSASVNVVNRTVSSSTTMNLTNIDSTITNHVQGGSLLMTVTNPFGVSGTLSATFVPDAGAPVVKSVALATGTSSPSITFTGPELHALLGHNVVLTFSGAVSGTSGSVSVSPKQVVLVNTHLDIALEVGGK